MNRIGLALVVFLALAAAGAAVWLATRPPVPPPAPPGEDDGPPTAIRFDDVTRAAGIDFVHHDSSTDMHYILETMGSGVAWIDHDGDGLLDLFLPQVGPLDPKSTDRPTPRFYRNTGDGSFTDVTRRVGLERPGYGMGAAVGDFDNDGFDDLVVTSFGEVVLYHNEPDGKGGRWFADVTARSGIRDPHWATSCAWGDIDGDGLLDLYVCNYVEVDLKRYTPCFNSRVNQRFLCHPRVFPATTHRLFRNDGNGTFSDISAASGIASAPPAPGLGVVIADLDGDGRQDVYVANDMSPAYLFHNQGKARFTETAVAAGCGLQTNGRYMAGMGIGLGDVDGSGRPSLFVTNYQKEANTLFLNRGKMYFTDATDTSRLGPPSVPFLGFGTVLFDADLDGLLDVAVTNGHVLRNAEVIENAPFRQTAQMFQGVGGATFNEVTRRVGPYFHERHVGRGLAWADFDNDGRPDLAFSNNGERAALLRNTSRTDNRWLRLELVGDGKRSNRNAIGAKVEVEYAGKRQAHWVIGGGSYLSASDRRLLIGLGEADRAERVKVTWPSGRVQEFTDLSARTWYRLREGKAEAVQGPTVREGVSKARP
jgi:hypothetical protein